MYSLIANGQYRNTSLGRDTWKSLIGSKASLQIGCNRQGFNAKSDQQHLGKDMAKARIGILGNNEHNCGKCDPESGLALAVCMMTTIHVGMNVLIESIQRD